MFELRDYACNYGESGGGIQQTGTLLGMSFPKAYTNAGDIAMLARETRTRDNARFCYLPFCHTVEAEALGAEINLGDENSGPRAKSCTYYSVDELTDLPEMDFDKGRISEVLKACKMLSDEGEYVALEITGPFAILNALIDITQIIKGWRKAPEQIIGIFSRLGAQLVEYMKQAKRAGVILFCYGDPSGGLSILGPKLAETVTRDFTAPFLRRSLELLDSETLMHLCPKTSFMLTGFGTAKWLDISLSKACSYEEACLEVRSKTDIVGQICIQNARETLGSGNIRGISLNL